MITTIKSNSWHSSCVLFGAMAVGLSSLAADAESQTVRFQTMTDASIPLFNADPDVPATSLGQFLEANRIFAFGGENLEPPGTPAGRNQLFLRYAIDFDVQSGEPISYIFFSERFRGGTRTFVLQDEPGNVISNTPFLFATFDRQGVIVRGIDAGRDFPSGSASIRFSDGPLDLEHGGRRNFFPFDTSFNEEFATIPDIGTLDFAFQQDFFGSETTAVFNNFSGITPSQLPFVDLDTITFGGFSDEDVEDQFMFGVIVDPGPLVADPDPVLGPGPSASVLFDDTINLPGDPALGNTIAGDIGDPSGDTLTTTQLNVGTGGSVASNFVSYSGAEININGGNVGDNFNAHHGVEVNITDGNVGTQLDAFNGSTINISGGTVGPGLEAFPLSLVNISGGTVGDSFTALAGSVVNIDGGFTGDGFNARERSQVNISRGFVGNNFTAAGIVNVSGGSIGNRLIAMDGSEVNITGGSIGFESQAMSGSTVNINGGLVGSEFEALSGSEVNVRDGELSQLFEAASGSVVNIKGGNVGINFQALDGSEINISGGAIGAGFSAFAGSQVNIFGTEFFLDGMPITPAAFSSPSIIGDRDAVLSGRLADGSSFTLSLASTFVFGAGFVDPGATLSITRACTADFNIDGAITSQDILDFVTAAETGEVDADIDGVSGTDFFDVIAFLKAFDTGCN